MKQETAWNRIGTLRDKFALVRCHDWILGFEARYVRQVGFPDLIESFELAKADRMAPRGHVGSGAVAGVPCSVWDLGMHLGLQPLDRAVVVLERPGGVVAFRCGEILAVRTLMAATRRDLPSGLTPQRPGLFRSATLLAEEGDETGRSELVYLIRASALLDRAEVVRVHKDWSSLASHA